MQKNKKGKTMKKVKVLTVVIGILTALVTTPGTVSAVEAGRVQIHGFVSQGYLVSDDLNYLAETKKGSAEFNEIGINFQTEPIERLRVGVQFFSRDLGKIGNNKVYIDWAMADYRFADEVGIRVGIIKIPFGFSHDEIDLDMTRTTVFLPLGVYEPRYRDLYMNNAGANAYGILQLGAMGSLEYSVYAGTRGSVNNDALNVKNAEKGLVIDKSVTRLQYGGRLTWNTPLEGFLVGGSFLKAEGMYMEGNMPAAMTAYIPGLGSLYPPGSKMSINVPNTMIWFIFSRYSYERLTITGEVHRMVVNSFIESDKPADPMVAAAFGFNGFDPDYINRGGWYAQMDYQLTSWLSAAVTYSEQFGDWDDPNGEDLVGDHYEAFRRDTTISTRFDLTPNWNVKFEAHIMDGIYDVMPHLQEDPDDIERYWNLYAVKTSFCF